MYWSFFWLCGVIWGSSFILIHIGVKATDPLHVAFLRLAVGALFMIATVTLTRQKWPRFGRLWGAFALLGLTNNALPFFLISWGEMSVESGITSVLNATTALFGLLIAHLAFREERMTPQKLIGVTLGFLGVVVLAARNWQGGEVVHSSLWGQWAILGASFCYAISTTFTKKVMQGANVPPTVMAALVMVFGALYTGLAVVFGAALGAVPLTTPVDMRPDALLAILTLGFLNTFVAYLLYYQVVAGLGAARTTMITYVVPPVALLLGVVFLGERMDAYIVIGAGMIFAGIGIVNLRAFNRLNVLLAKPKTA